MVTYMGFGNFWSKIWFGSQKLVKKKIRRYSWQVSKNNKIKIQWEFRVVRENMHIQMDLQMTHQKKGLLLNKQCTISWSCRDICENAHKFILPVKKKLIHVYSRKTRGCSINIRVSISYNRGSRGTTFVQQVFNFSSYMERVMNEGTRNNQ